MGNRCGHTHARHQAAPLLLVGHGQEQPRPGPQRRSAKVGEKGFTFVHEGVVEK